MTNATAIIEQAMAEEGYGHLPARVREIAERHRQRLLDLANALLAAGRDEDEVVFVIQQASDSFSAHLRSETKGPRS